MIWLLINFKWLFPALIALVVAGALISGVGVPVLRELVKRTPTWVFQAAAAAMAVSIASSWLIGIGESRVQERWDQQQLDFAELQRQAKENARVVEERHRAEYKAIADRFLAKQDEADEKHKAEIAALRSGAGPFRVRERFTCSTAPGVPEAPANSEGTVAADERGFGVEDAAVALGIAADGDRAIRRLNALIEAAKVCSGLADGQ